MLEILKRNKTLSQFTGGLNENSDDIDFIEQIMDRNFYSDVYSE
jgi:hypothetical protein